MIGKEVSCILCGSKSVLKDDKYQGYQKPFTFEIYHCEYCDTAFSLPRIADTKEVYDNIYKNKGDVPGYNRYWTYADAVKNLESPLDYLAESENTYWGIREALKQVVDVKLFVKILEVGSGLGYLTYGLNKNGYNTIGIDISETAVDQAIKKFGDYFICSDLFAFAEKNKDCYDVVILTEVIEHINAPLFFLQTVMKLVKPQGYVILTTPNKSIYSEKAIWATDNPPVHCWWFSEKSILYLGEKLNAKVTLIDFSEFYKTHFTYFLNLPSPNSFSLDENGEVIFNLNPKVTRFSSFRKMIFSHLPIIKRYYSRIVNLNNPHIKILKNRGTVLCAIMQKV